MYETGQTVLPAASLDWVVSAPDRTDPQLLKLRARGAARFVGPAISLGVLVAVVFQLRELDFAHVRAIVPSSPVFWLVFAATYFTAPFADWIIFRRLWTIPASGFLALLRKLIGNEILLGYIGELYFYDWARKRTAMTAAPFGAVKDVAILSALVGNAVTIAMLALAWPLIGALHLGLESRMLLLSVAVVLVTSLVAMLFRKRLFSLPRSELWFVVGVHFARIVATTGLAALAWHLVLPGVALFWWLLLATIRMLLSRLPFLPNKDLVFAGIAVFLVGHDVEIATLIAMMASLILATHLVLGAGLMTADLATARTRP